jgi:hypothetical protein
MMPFDKKFDDVYQHIRAVAGRIKVADKVRCYRLDEIKYAGGITHDLIQEIEDASLCIADVSGKNANVMWEIGYAMAMRKPVILLAKKSEKLPFDTKDQRTIMYDRLALAATLEKPLLDAIRATLGKYEIFLKSAPVKEIERPGFAIAVTGSMKADQARIERTTRSFLAPYLSKKAIWYIGSVGQVDETVAEFLGRMAQEVIVVGYHAYDISDRMLELVGKYHFSFTYPKKGEILKGTEAPSDRDFTFAVKADLIVLMWDGSSPQTRKLLNWCRSQEKDHLVAFV